MVIVKPRKKETEEWFKLLLDTTIEEDQPLWEAPRRYIRGSGVGDPCVRSLALDMLGHRVPFQARTKRIFETGNKIEEVNIEVLERAKALDSKQGKVEFKFEDGILIKGHYDAVVKKDKEKLLLEIKSINEFDFQKLPDEHGYILAGDSPLMKRYPKYIHQWNTYAGADSTPKKGMILFEAKNTQNQKTYFLRHDQLLFADLLYKLEEAWRIGIQGEIPAVPKDFDPQDSKDSVCGRCPKRYLCKELTTASVDLTTIKNKDDELRG